MVKCHKPQASSFKLINWLLAACSLWLVLPSCRLTDHNEGDNDVTASDVNIPASGYQNVDTNLLPRFAFDSASIDFGRISQGTKVERSYHFTNVGGGDLVITNVHASCGCTVAKDWPKEPVHPGQRGTITVTFDSDQRSGHQEKVITVVANTRKASTPLFLHGEVVAPAGTLPVE